MDEEEPTVKASVTESNGEISCSIEETNRIRALLGLKPLKVDSKSKEQISVQNFQNQKEGEAKYEILYAVLFFMSLISRSFTELARPKKSKIELRARGSRGC